MNIFRFEFKTYVKSLWLWGISLCALQFVFMFFFPTLSKDAAILDLVIKNYPKELLQAFGMGEVVPLATVLGYYTFVFTFVQLCLAIQSSYYGFHFLSVEEREQTADFLFSKPVTRREIFLSKYLAGFTALLITNTVVWISTFIVISIFRDGKSYELNKLVTLLASILLFQLFFFSIGMMVTALTRRIRSVLSYSMALSFGLYVLNTLRGIVGGHLLGLVSPFYHFEPAYILKHGSWIMNRVMISIVIIILSTVISYSLYLKRNIHGL